MLERYGIANKALAAFTSIALSGTGVSDVDKSIVPSEFNGKTSCKKIPDAPPNTYLCPTAKVYITRENAQQARIVVSNLDDSSPRTNVVEVPVKVNEEREGCLIGADVLPRTETVYTRCTEDSIA